MTVVDATMNFKWYTCDAVMPRQEEICQLVERRNCRSPEKMFPAQVHNKECEKMVIRGACNPIVKFQNRKEKLTWGVNNGLWDLGHSSLIYDNADGRRMNIIAEPAQSFLGHDLGNLVQRNIPTEGSQYGWGITP